MLVLPDDLNSPNCGAGTWGAEQDRTGECQSSGLVQRLLTDREPWLRESANIEAEIISSAPPQHAEDFPYRQ